MNRLIKLTIGVISAVALSACSSQADKTPSTDNIDVNSANQTHNMDEIYENGWGETQTERYKMVVLPARIDLATQNAFPLSPSNLSSTLSHEIITTLYDTHRFDILASDNLSTDIDDRIPEKNTADFYLQSTLSQLDTQETIRILKATGQGVEEKTVSATVLYQLIDAKSHKIVFSRSIRYQLKSTTNNETFSTTISNTLKSIANLMKNEIINDIYPIRILAEQNGKIILDYPLALGSQCDVLRLGKKVKDAYTDSLLGYEQTVVGKLVITQASSVISYGEIETGQAIKGDICKPIQPATQVATEWVKRTPQGGVVLPFD